MCSPAGQSEPIALRSADVHELGRRFGFERLGIADASVPLDAEFEHYEAFVDAGMHGDMSYLQANREVRRRLDTSHILEGARSVICVAERYAPTAPSERDAPTAPSERAAVTSASPETETAVTREAGSTEALRSPGLCSSIARYARGLDYHDHLRKRLRAFAAAIRAVAPGVRARPMSDTAPVLERAWAARAGLGFVGKNGLIIVPGMGSYVLLGEIVTTLRLEPDAPLADRCGSCRLCLDACPTQAFDRPYVLDARRCVAYLTIECRGVTPESLRSAVGAHWFGCDACQDVCPHNRASRPPARAEYRSLDVWRELSLEALIRLDEGELTERIRRTPLRRAGRSGLVRNALTVLGNRREPSLRPLFEALAASDPDPIVREHARWALAELDSSGQR